MEEEYLLPHLSSRSSIAASASSSVTVLFLWRPFRNAGRCGIYQPKNNRLKRLIRSAELEQTDACIARIDYISGRKLNKELIGRLATCEYIAEYRNIFITGATGSGKTYMACAFGMEACRQYFTVRYIRLPDLLLELEAARNTGNFAKVLCKYTKPLLLIIDEWLLLKLSESESKNLFELIHKRRKKSSTIFCSQIREEGCMNASVVMTTHSQMRSWIESSMMHTKSISKVSIHLKTFPCVKFMVSIRNKHCN